MNTANFNDDADRKPSDSRKRPPAGDVKGESASAPNILGNRVGDRIFRRSWTAFMVLATSLPYLLNHLLRPTGQRYTWILPPYPEDSLAYLAWCQQAAHGAFWFQLKYTALPHPPFLFQPFFLVSGWIAAGLNSEIGVVLWVLKLLGVIWFFSLLYKYTDQIGFSKIQSRIASILVGASGGFGGLLAWLGVIDPWGEASPDLWLVDSNTFWSLLWNPLYPYSLILILLTIHHVTRGASTARPWDFWCAGLATGILALIHPYSQPLLIAFAAILVLVRRRGQAWLLLARYSCILLPFTLYVAWVAKMNPMVAKHSMTGEMISPPVWTYAAGFGLPLVFWLAGLVAGRLDFLRRYWPLMVWLILAVIFCYLPVWFQRKFIFGAHIPLCLLAGVSLDLLFQKYAPAASRKRVLIAAAALLVPVLISTPVYLLIGQRREVRQNADDTYYLNPDLHEGLMFLKSTSRAEDVVFASVETSRLIPAFSGNTVLWGHWAQSVDAEQRENWFSRLSQLNEMERAREFWGLGIRYIFADGDFKKVLQESGNGWVTILTQTEKVFENRLVTIYRNRDQAGSVPPLK